MSLTSIESPAPAGLARVFWASFALASVVFHIGLVFSGLVPNLVSRPLHLVFVLPFVLIWGHEGFARMSGLVLTALGGGAALWVALSHDALADQYGFLEGQGQVIIAILLICVVLEAARRAIGWPLPLVAAAALLYGLFGQHIPGRFGHSGTPLESFLGTLAIAEGGLWGSLTAVSVNVVAIFVIFGAVLNAGEAGQGFMNVAAAAAGRLRGGAAKVSVLSSALFGSISGSASANVASTGAITLPAMERLGYPRRIAGAVEAVASSGGQIMPPLMGAGAFVMVELTGTPYTAIMAAAALPAALYFWAVWIGIDGYARRFDLRGLAARDRPALRDVAITSGFFLVPFALLLWGMFALGVTPQYAACLSIFAGAALLLTGSDLRIDLGRAASRAETAVLTAARQVALIGSIIFCASLVIGVLGVTGLGVKITSLILSASGGLLWPSLLLTAFACLILGMEVPTTAAYVICVSVAGPALTELGMEPLQAHLFVFWYALLSTITPPVCGAVSHCRGHDRGKLAARGADGDDAWCRALPDPARHGGQPGSHRAGAIPGAALLAALKIGTGLALVSWSLVRRKALWLRGGALAGGLLAVLWPL